MGNYNSYSQLSGDPVGHYRFNDYGVYAADSWKATRKLSLDLGSALGLHGADVHAGE
jgi:hypothetical protein